MPTFPRALAFAAVLACAAPLPAQSRAAAPLKVFISIDMEGLAGVVNGTDVQPGKPDYPYFRSIMAGEANAAIDGAFRAGATEVVVRDSHGNKDNMIPGDLDPRARLIRGVSTGGKNMMEGIDSTFGAVVFVGFHAKAGTPKAILAHTSTGNVVDISINGVSLPEGGYNALIAGLYGVPVVFAAGDRALTEQITGLLGPIETVATKYEVAGAINGLAPKAAQDAIRTGVERAVRERGRAQPYRLAPPYTMTLKVKQERPLHAGATRVREGEFTFTHADLLQVLTAFNAMK
jgi:D-amino peptidase